MSNIEVKKEFFYLSQYPVDTRCAGTRCFSDIEKTFKDKGRSKCCNRKDY